jgi:hypothetical protein
VAVEACGGGRDDQPDECPAGAFFYRAFKEGATSLELSLGVLFVF